MSEAIEWVRSNAEGRRWQLLALNPFATAEEFLVLEGTNPTDPLVEGSAGVRGRAPSNSRRTLEPLRERGSGEEDSREGLTWGWRRE